MQAAIAEAHPPALRGRGIRCRKMRPSRAARAGAGLDPVGLSFLGPHRSRRRKGRCGLEMRWLESLPCRPQLRRPAHPPSGGAASGAARCALAVPSKPVLVSSWLEWILLDPIGLEGERAGVSLSCGGSSHCRAGRNYVSPPTRPQGARHQVPQDAP